MDGVICQWNDKKAYGFIKPDLSQQHQYFFHVSSVHGARTAIKKNVRVTFELDDTGDRGLAAKNVRLAGSINSIVHLPTIAIFAGLPLLMLSPWYQIEPLIVLGYWLMSIIAFIAYWSDKSKAQHGKWRTSESTLHLLELLGGWPGAMAAQRVFRHKIRKGSYLLVFWLIVIVHTGISVDTLLFNGSLPDQLATFLDIF